MKIHVDIRSTSSRKRLYRRDVLQRIAERVCSAERAGAQLELSVLFCDDPFMTELNHQYRKVSGPTDVLSFSQEPAAFHGARVLGDVVISLETVERFCESDPARMREEVRLLFCHGLLHLLGYTHQSAAERQEMARKQACYLGISKEEAWHGPKNG